LVSAWQLYGLILLTLGFVAMATGIALRRRRQPARLPFIYGTLALVAGGALMNVRS
jgi:hypothetical protein